MKQKTASEKKSINDTKSAKNKQKGKKVDKVQDKVSKTSKVFSIVYWALFAVLLVLLIVGNRVEKTQLTDTLFFVLYFVMVEAFLFLMYAQNYIIFKNRQKRLISYFAFVINALIFALRLVVDGQTMLLVAFVYNTVLLCCVLVKHLLHKTKHKTVKFFDKKIFIVIALALLLAMISGLYHTYVQQNIILLYALIPMAVILIAFAILSFTVFKKTYQQLAKSIWNKIAIVLAVLLVSFCYGMAAVDLANTSFAKNPQQIQCVVVDKKIQSGYRQITQYVLYVDLNDQRLSINVSSDTYNSKEIDDILLVNLFGGNLNLPYYECAE